VPPPRKSTKPIRTWCSFGIPIACRRIIPACNKRPTPSSRRSTRHGISCDRTKKVRKSPAPTVSRGDRPVPPLVPRPAMAPQASDRLQPNRASSITPPTPAITTTPIAKPPGSTPTPIQQPDQRVQDQPIRPSRHPHREHHPRMGGHILRQPRRRQPRRRQPRRRQRVGPPAMGPPAMGPQATAPQPITLPMGPHLMGPQAMALPPVMPPRMGLPATGHRPMDGHRMALRAMGMGHLDRSGGMSGDRPPQIIPRVISISRVIPPVIPRASRPRIPLIVRA